jgi:hypothetical protein
VLAPMRKGKGKTSKAVVTQSAFTYARSQPFGEVDEHPGGAQVDRTS